MRRSDREIKSFDKIVEVLKKCGVLHLAMSAEDRPYVIPVTFGYSAENGKLTVYFHSALEGRKIDMLRKNPQVCFEAECSFKLITKEQACEWSAEYESVVGEGGVKEITDQQEKKEALDALLHHYGCQGEPDYDAASLSGVTLFKIEAESLSGKHKL